MKSQTNLKKFQETHSNLLIVDGLNVLKYPNGEENQRNLEIIRKWAKELRISVFFVFPGLESLRRKIRNDEDVIFLDRFVYDDIGIIEHAIECNAPILSNDRYREFRKEYKNYNFNQVFQYAIANNNIITEATAFFDYPFNFVFTESGSKIILEVVN